MDVETPFVLPPDWPFGVRPQGLWELGSNCLYETFIQVRASGQQTLTSACYRVEEDSCDFWPLIFVSSLAAAFAKVSRKHPKDSGSSLEPR